MTTKIFSFFKQNNKNYEVADAQSRNNISTIIDDINVINDKLNDVNIINRYYLCIGDSYSVSYSGFKSYWDICRETLGISEDHWFNNSVVGLGLGDGSWLAKLRTWVSENADKLDKITDVFIMGGFNDAAYDVSVLLSAFESLVNTIKEYFPNIKNIYTCCFGWCAGSDSIRQGIVKNVKTVYRNSVQYGCIPIVDLEYVFHDYNNFQSDLIHPNQLAQTYCGKLLASFLRGGSCKPYHAVGAIGVDWTGVLPSNTFDILCGQDGDRVVLEFKYNAVWTAYADLSGLVAVGTIRANSSYLHGTGFMAETLFINGQAAQLIVNDLTVFLRLPSGMTIARGAPFNISGILYIPCDYT